MSKSNNSFIMPRPSTWCWIFVAASLTACSSQPLNRYFGSDSQAQAGPQAHAMSGRSIYAGNHLLRAHNLIQSGSDDAAQRELDLINPNDMSLQQQSRFGLLQAQLDLNAGDVEHAMQQLRNVHPVFLGNTDKIIYYQSLAFGQVLTGQIAQSLETRINLAHLLEKPEQQQANMVAIIDMLGTVPEESLAMQLNYGAEFRGWVALAKILQQRQQFGVDMADLLQGWQQEYPGHPANAEYLMAYLATQQITLTSQDTLPLPPEGLLAVFLPTSGPYAPAGVAVKQGLQVANRVASHKRPQPLLKFYDSGQGDIAELYRQAAADRAKLIIGPLVKEQIEAMVSQNELTVPVLALNHVEDLSRANLYQFGLSPIDEAEALALKARGDGRQSAWILVQDSEQGRRIGSYLEEAWQSRGGNVIGIQYYDSRGRDIADRLERLLAMPIYGQADDNVQPGILLNATHSIASELAMQLKYRQRNDITVYAMPAVYSGHPNPALDSELGSFGFCDAPWFFPEFFHGPLSQAAVRESWQGIADPLIRLVALGIDAYNLSGQLTQLALEPYAGATGQLSLNNQNRIVRKLVCAQFKAGLPVASGYAE